MSDERRDAPGPFDEAEFDKFFKKAADDDPNYQRPEPESVLAYLEGKATPTQQAEVRDALTRSSRFRQELLEMAQDLETLGQEATARAFKNAPAPRVPSMNRFLRQGAARSAAGQGEDVRHPFLAWLRQVPTAGPALLAASLMVLLAYPAYRGLVTLPRVEKDLEEVRGGSAAGIFQLNVLREPTRGGTEEQVVRVGKAAAVVFLGAEVDLGDSKAGDQRYRIEIIDPAGRSVWAEEMSTESLHSAWEKDGRINLALPARALQPGSLRLSIQRVSPQGPQAVSVILFRVVQQ